MTDSFVSVPQSLCHGFLSVPQSLWSFLGVGNTVNSSALSPSVYMYIYDIYAGGR